MSELNRVCICIPELGHQERDNRQVVQSSHVWVGVFLAALALSHLEGTELEVRGETLVKLGLLLLSQVMLVVEVVSGEAGHETSHLFGFGSEAASGSFFVEKLLEGIHIGCVYF